MAITVTTWLSLTLAIAALAWFGLPRWLTVFAMLTGSAIAYAAAPLPLGMADYRAPASGKYTVLGARVDIPNASNSGGAIYVLLDNGNGEPHYYVLPYTTAKVQQLQNAMDGAANGEGDGVEGELGEDGEMAFHPKPVTDNGPKEAEQPMTEVE